MDKNSLYIAITTMVPVKQEGRGFRKTIVDSFKNYQKIVEELEEVYRPNDWDGIVLRIKQLCDGINRAVESEYKGMRHSAYTSVKNQLDGYKTQRVEIKGLANNATVQEIASDTVFYRMRKVAMEEQRKMKRGDIFHIPLDKRGLVEMQRFSVPGYPCLYLSHRVYGCWEEMGRPDFGTIMVSRFISQEAFKVLDIRVPSKKDWQDDFVKCLLFFPLVIASMVQVEEHENSYKPEYLIPQLLTEWIITHNREDRNKADELIGIMYTSAQKNDDFDYPDDSYDNVAIPVLSPLSSDKYCKRLKELFKLSIPTYYNLEVLKHGRGVNVGEFGLNEEEQKEQNINLSDFGDMEDYLEIAAVDFIN